MRFILLGGVLTSFFAYTGLVTMFTYTFLSLIYLWWCMSSSPTFTRVVSFLSLYTCFLFLYAINYFCFTQRCLDEFCLKWFRNTGCQSLLAINSLLAKFFKSLCHDRFYCIQQVNMSWVIYDFSHIWFVCCGFVTDCQRGRLLRTYFV